MKNKKEELDVDFIGGEGALTAIEEKALSDYFRQKKLVKTTSADKRPKRKEGERSMPVGI